jgi:hypothetical protein
MAESQRTASTTLQAFVAKWIHHDAHIYRRLTTVWTVEAAVVSAAVIVMSRTPLDETINQLTLAALVFGFWFVAWIAWQMRQISRLDRKVRNTFNVHIVTELREHGVLLGDDRHWNVEHWSAENDSHPINLWHTSDPFGRGADTRASTLIEKQIIVLLLLDLVIGLGLFVWMLSRQF